VRIQRTFRSIALLVIAATSAAACSATYDPVIGRDLVCGRTPHDLCVRVADYAMSDAADLDVEINGSPMTVTVNGEECKRIGRGPNGPHPPAERCWRVEGDVPALTYHFGNWVYQNEDGTLGVAW